MTLSLDEFLRRFLLHLLPKGFVRIRHFGFLAHRRRAVFLPLCFHLLGSAPQEPQIQQEALRCQWLTRSLVLPPMRWAHGDSREAYCRSDPAPFSTPHDHGCRMRQLSTVPNLCGFRLAQSLCAWPFYHSRLASFSGLRSPVAWHFPQPWSSSVVFSAQPHHLNAPGQHPSIPFKFHKVRVRRKRGRFPSSRSIESAQAHPARASLLPRRASDTALGRIVTNVGNTSWKPVS